MAVDPFLAACRGEPHDRVPVWFMRQAGRSLPEYRRIRERHAMHEVIATPDLAVEVTLQPVRRYNVDAAILFSDIVTPLQAIGVGIELREGIGPVIREPFRRPADVQRLRPLEPDEDIAYVLETVRTLASELDVPLIGFAGAPFTLASYLIEGGPSKNHATTKALMLGAPATWHALVERLADITSASLRAQVAAGAQAIQLFDSWAGALTPQDYAQSVLPVTRRVLEGLSDLAVPRIHFGVATGELLVLLAEAGADVVGVDWRVPLDTARARLAGRTVGVQGNLDPAVCLAPWHVVEARTRDVLRRAGGSPRHIFNLGHGVLPDTDPATLARVADLVHHEGMVRTTSDTDALASGGGARSPADPGRGGRAT
ncbi:MAG: uroporphyrinogen decarboxylase [Actinobacteria bacterium]|nr:uroporphyrinogen decarboxylase [Actinomycetota bacterium]